MAAPAPARVATAYPHHRGAGESLRAGIWRMFEDPSSSPAAKVVALLTVLAIVLSTVAYVVQTLPAYVYSPDPAWDALERTMITLFTLELAIRLACCPSYRAFFSSPLNWIDVAAVVPFYVELALVADSAAAAGNSGALRVLRLARIFRVFRVSRYLPWMRVFVRALLLSLQPLLMLVFVVLIGVVVFASAIYYAERGEWDATLAGGTWVRRGADGSATESPFRSIPDSMWWAVVTMTTVGYGDAVPVTSWGRFIASLAALCGILVVAIPITVISTNFNNEYGAMLKATAVAKARTGLLRRQFRHHTAGLAAVLEEVDELVDRNAREFRTEVDALFDAARVELASEVGEVVKMAFERRRQLHLAALAAGRLHLPEGRAAPREDGGGEEEEEEDGREREEQQGGGARGGGGAGGSGGGDARGSGGDGRRHGHER